ncbi:hypothetical protein [Sinorhizobium meliloti]|uniref:hypothetical protein n=1 Tax=Rhizobium meliloti TaxID=382 RepID=UPI000FD94282|nr:hypothetical protein [Sinorhizobium meliloti]RVM91464.1 hypothetical protein CN122_14805 [Sinorhizobium meliloti]
MEVGQDPAHFWQLTLREIDIVIRGSVVQRRHRQNDLITAAWFMARLSAYAPTKPKHFIKLQKILLREHEQERPEKPDWRHVYAKVMAWGSKKANS